MRSLPRSISRRSFLTGFGASCAVSVAGIQNAVASGYGAARLYRPATNESLVIPSRWQQDDLLKCSYIFRDVRDHNKAAFIDPGLLDIILRLNIAADKISGRPCEVYISSAYRTRLHNSKIEGAAKASLHMEARALDFSIPGFEHLAFAKLAAMVGAGGIGVYQSFTHIDSGRDRTWVVNKIR